jgi:hypothetical protein
MHIEVSTDKSVLLYGGFVYYFELTCGEKPKIKLYKDRTTLIDTIKLKKDYVVDILTCDENKLIGQIIV